MTDSSQNDAKTDIARLSPDKLVRRFRHSGIVACLLLALGLHVVVLGGTSVDYIHGLVDPAWKTQHDAEVEKARKAKAAANAPTTKTGDDPAGRQDDRRQGQARHEDQTRHRAERAASARRAHHHAQAGRDSQRPRRRNRHRRHGHEQVRTSLSASSALKSPLEGPH